MMPRAASQAIPSDIFDFPAALSTKQIGTFWTSPVLRQWVHAISI